MKLTKDYFIEGQIIPKGSDLFIETLDSENWIRQLVKNIIPQLAESIYEEYQEISDMETYESFTYYVDKYNETPLIGKILKDELVIAYNEPSMLPFYEYLMEGKMFDAIKICISNMKNRLDGVYRGGQNRVVEIYIAKDIGEMLFYRSAKQIEEYLYSAKSKILNHELTHAYDDFRSSGRYHPAEYKSTDKGNSWEDYAKQDLEVNARYAELLVEFEKLELRLYQPFDQIISNLKSQFSGFTSLSKSQYERLIKRLYQWYSQLLTPEEEERAISLSLNLWVLTAIDNWLEGKEAPEVKQNPIHQLRISNPMRYIRKKKEELLTGNYDKEAIQSYTLTQNPYTGFSHIPNLKDRIKKIENQGLDLPVLQTWKDGLENVKRKLKLSDQEIEKIKIIFRGLHEH